jgi:hypothetical protein
MATTTVAKAMALGKVVSKALHPTVIERGWREALSAGPMHQMRRGTEVSASGDSSVTCLVKFLSESFQIRPRWVVA